MSLLQMINSLDRITEVVNSLDELNEKLSSHETAISCQKTEIVKTEAIIKQYQDWLKSQNDMLETFMKQKETMEADKAKMMKLIQDYKNVTINGVKDTNSTNGGYDNTPIHLSFEDNFEIAKITRSIKYYREAIDRLGEVEPHNEINYHNQTTIPNKLKASTQARRMLIYRIDAIGEYPLQDIIRQPTSMPIDIHVSTGYGELLCVRGPEQQPVYHVTRLECCKSYSIFKDQTLGTRFVLLVNLAPMVMAIDIHTALEERFENSVQISEKEGYAVIPPTLAEYPDCFVKKSLSLKETREKLLFFDANFARNVHEAMVPIALTVVDYDGTVPIDTLLCPRTQIKDYCEYVHGITEGELLGAADIEDILKRFYRLTYDRILVGHNLRTKLQELRLDLRYVGGVRDLRSCAAVRAAITPAKETYKLCEIADRVLRQPGTKGVYRAHENAHTVRNVYRALEGRWKDDVSVADLSAWQESAAGDKRGSRWGPQKGTSGDDAKRQKTVSK